MILIQRLTCICLLAGTILFGVSCGNVKNLQYVQGSFDTTKLSKIQFAEPLIQKGDMINIAVYSDNSRATAAVVYQQPSVSAETAGEGLTGSQSTLSVPGNTPTYLVSQTGDIQLYKFGLVHVEGLTKKQLADTLTRMYTEKDLLKNPYIDVRLVNYKITLIGEVTRPGSYSIPSEKVNIFEALSLAGDITVYGKRNNVLVVREANGVRQFAQLDLSKPEVFASPYYYLQQNDIVIVDVGKNKTAVNDQMTVRNVSVAASLLATIAILLNIFK